MALKDLKKKRNAKIRTNCFLQGILAGILCLCIFGTVTWMKSGSSLSTMNRRFEETDLYCETVERIIREKISMQQDRQLFEEDGEYQELKEIDIRQYISGNAEQQAINRNTTYYLCDLIDFAMDGALYMEDRINSLSRNGRSEESIGRILAEEAPSLETVLPVTGNYLADYAQLSASPDTAVLDNYRCLCEASQDISFRYNRYLALAGSGTDPDKAPSNVWYYIENTGTGQRYTNLGVKSLVAARTLLLRKNDAEILFEGERRFNIMVADSEYLDNETAAEYFMQSRFLGSGERVLIGADTTYSAGDELHSEAMQYRRRKPYLIAAVAVGMFSGLLLMVLLGFSIADVIKDARTRKTAKIPSELAFGTLLIAGIGWWMAFSAVTEQLQYRSRLFFWLCPSVMAVVEYWFCLFGLLYLIRRFVDTSLWKESVLYSVVMGGRYVYSAKRSSERLVLLYVLFVVFNMIFLLVGGFPGTVMALILNLAALLYLMRDVVGHQSVREGIGAISRGDLDYRINTQVLTGESREMGEAINEMGEGLKRSVNAMLEHERLKSELITNVSHDLKTPLTSILNYVDLLKREKLPDGKAREYVQILDDKARRLKQLTEDLIEVSRINSGNVVLDMQPLDFTAFLRQACGEFEDRFEQRDLTIRLELPEYRNGDLPESGTGNGEDETVRRRKRPCGERILADGAQLWRIFENLLGNAAKYARSGTEVSVILTAGDHMVRLKIRNLPQEKIHVSASTLEERFSRGDESRSTEGSGLGLSIARSLTELMNGTFELYVEEELFEARLAFPSFEEPQSAGDSL